MRISGVPVGKVKAIEPDAEDRPLAGDDRAGRQVRPLPSDAQGDAAAEDAARRDLRRADARHRRRRDDPGGRPAAPRATCPRPSSSTRSCGRSTRRRARRSRSGRRRRPRRSRGHGRDINDALGNLGPFAEDASELVDILNRQEPAVRRLISDTGVVFEALTERDGQLRDLIENSNRVFATTAQRDRELQEAFVALPTFERESRETVSAADAVRARHRPARHAAAPGRARAVADADRPGGARAGPRGAVPGPRPAVRRVRQGLPRRRARARGPAAAARPGRPGAAPAQPRARLPRALQARADRVLRQHGRGDAGDDGRRSKGPLHYLRTQNPLNPENLAVVSQAAADQPAEPVHAAGRLRHSCAPGCRRTRRASARAARSRRSPTSRRRSIPPTLPDLSLPVPVPVPVPGRGRRRTGCSPTRTR